MVDSADVSERIDDLLAVETPSGGTVRIPRIRLGGGDGPRVVLVAGLRGDTPEGVRVVHSVLRFLRTTPLQGTVDVFPCLNPMAAHLSTRLWPGFDVDLARAFPGREDGHVPAQVAHAFLHAVEGAAQVIELRGAHPAFREEPTAQVRADQPEAIERAHDANVRLVWMRPPDPAGSSSLTAHVPGLLRLDGGLGGRLDDRAGAELADGVLHVLARMGLVPDGALPFHWAALHRARAVADDQVVAVRAPVGGLFLPTVAVGAAVRAGEPIGELVEPLTGEALAPVPSPGTGLLLARRESPVVYAGSLVARVVLG